ncbi:MAG: hypothetical protein KF764_21405 [Labilithrix sp.]|nr:hypothetical protein [Labilithrix sp.]MBX3223065.1 hypothetical protein [Labilithrix sp.]
MLNSDAVTRELLSGSPDGVSLDDSSPIPGSSGVRSSSVSLTGVVPERLQKLSRIQLTDTQLALVVSAVLFLVGAWPLALTEVPPYQDLPNHLATLTVIENLKAYPEYVFNGFFKTNAALFTWLYVVGKLTGVKLAARLFALLTLALNAFILPRFVLRISGSRRRMLMASLFAWPMVHNWFVSMGMLDFAIAVPLSLALLLAVNRQRTAPTIANGLAIVALGVATWYAHVFPLLVVHLLILVESLVQTTWRERFRAIRAMAIPLMPVTLLALASVAQHVRDTTGPMTGFMDFKKLLAPWELGYNLWAEWFWGYSNLSISSVVPCVALAAAGFWGLRRRTEPAPPFFSSYALVALVLLYCFIPYKMTNWFHVNSRLIPYFWVGLLLFVPERLPKPLIAALGLSGVLYTAGMGIDYARLDEERREFSAGIDAVPEGAQLLPLLFKHKGASDNTRNLLHMWGYYVVERKTSAPLLFAHSRSFPVTYSVPPPVSFNHLVLESFAPEMNTPATTCKTASRFDDCDALFETTWRKFYAEATPRYDHLLLWEPSPEALAMIPNDYERTFARGRLMIYARRDVAPKQATKY